MRMLPLAMALLALMGCTTNPDWPVWIEVPIAIQNEVASWPQQIVLRYEADDMQHSSGVLQAGVLCAPQDSTFTVFTEIVLVDTGQGRKPSLLIEAWMTPLETFAPVCGPSRTARGLQLDPTLKPRAGEPSAALNLGESDPFAKDVSVVLRLEAAP